MPAVPPFIVSGAPGAGKAPVGDPPAWTDVATQAELDAFGGALTDIVVARRRSAHYYTAAFIDIPAATAVYTNNVLYLAPFPVGYPVTVDRIGIRVVTAGEAGSLLRLGIYADSGTGKPGNLVVDAGIIPGDVAATSEIIINVSLAARSLYWVGAAVQACPTTRPIVLSGNASPLFVPKVDTLSLGAAPGGAWILEAAGALPASFAAGSYLSNSYAPLVVLRIV